MHGEKPHRMQKERGCDRYSEHRDAQVGPSGGLFAFFAHIASTWRALKPSQCYVMVDHLLCLANVRSMHK